MLTSIFLDLQYIRVADQMSIGHSLRNGSWYRCADGSMVELLDLLLLVFPIKGLDAVGNNVCYESFYMNLPYAMQVLPNKTQTFSPDDLVDSIIALLLLSVIVTVALVVAKNIWEAIDPNFQSITPSHKKWYVVANISKSFFLGCLALSTKYWYGAYKAHILDEFQPIELKRCIAVYITTDLVALYMVPKLPVSTILHHVVTTSLSLLVFGINLKIKGFDGILGFAKMGLLYGVMSTIPFLVNAYLALRVVYPKAMFVKSLCFLSLATYLVCCGLNWSIHLMWIFGYWGHFDFSFYPVMYSVLLVFIVNDDIVLIKWLIRQNSPINEKDKVQ